MQQRLQPQPTEATASGAKPVTSVDGKIHGDVVGGRFVM